MCDIIVMCCFIGEWEQAVYRKDKKKKTTAIDEEIISDKSSGRHCEISCTHKTDMIVLVLCLLTSHSDDFVNIKKMLWHILVSF